jgi:hypothetical protein
MHTPTTALIKGDDMADDNKPAKVSNMDMTDAKAVGMTDFIDTSLTPEQKRARGIRGD